MTKRIYLLTSLFITLLAVGCSDDDAPITENIVPLAGNISGGPFTFCVDGSPDMVSGVSISGTNSIGSNSSWVVTDDAGMILGLPPTLEALEGVDFDEAGPGVCFIWYLRYENGLTGLEMGMNANNLDGDFDLSNSITVNRNRTMAGMISGGPFEFDVDGDADFVTGIILDSASSEGSNSTWVITDADGTILGMPPTLEAVEGVNFDEAGAGVCLIWYLRFEDGIQGAEMGMNANDLEGCFSLSNALTVTRNQVAHAGRLEGGPFEFCVDGMPDNVSGITLDSTNAFGEGSTWIITDADGTILGMPPTLEAVGGVDFDEAGAGVCLIWYARYQGEISGAEMGMNANAITGDFDLSNPIVVNRKQTVAGVLSGGPYEFTVDGMDDFVTGLMLDTSNAVGTNATFIITDAEGNILGLPPTLEAVNGVNFDGAGVGVCLIWHLKYENGLTGLEVNLNANDLSGCFSLSNAIEVNRIAM